jgi:hypothetical protein
MVSPPSADQTSRRPGASVTTARRRIFSCRGVPRALSGVFDPPISKGRTYTATFELNDENGILLTRRLTIRGT